MLRIGTIDDPTGFLATADRATVTLDIETMDKDDYRNEPIISYAFSILSGSLKRFSCPTFGSIIENLEEENNLLSELLKLLRSCNAHGITLSGHNVNCLHEYLPTVVSWKTEGYDLPKIIQRATHHSLKSDFISSLKTYDTMDQAVAFYDHSQHNHLSPYGEKQRWLRLTLLESDLNIIRPDGSKKLGSQVRDIYMSYLSTRDQTKLKEIMLYNCVDAISESIVARIFNLCVNECGSCKGLVPPRNRCTRIPSEFRIGSMMEWKQLCHCQFTKE